MITTKGRYALRVMVDFALNAGDRFVTLREVSERQGMSVKYLEQIVSQLTKAGFLRSLRGNSGGYQLARSPEAYTAGDILRAAEGSLAPITCLKDDSNRCDNASTCATLPFWENYYKVVTDYVDSVTLRDLADGAIQKRG